MNLIEEIVIVAIALVIGWTIVKCVRSEVSN